MDSSNKMLDVKEIQNLSRMEFPIIHALVSGNSAFWHWEGNGGKMYLSASYYLMLGYTPYESSRKETGIIDHIHLKDKAKTESGLERFWDQNSENINLEFRCLSKTGKILWMSLSGGISISENGSVKKNMQGVVSNISKHKTTEINLVEKERRLTTLMNHLPGMVYRNRMIKGEWHSEFVSNGVASILGYDKNYFMANRKTLYKQAIDVEDRKEIWVTINKSIKENRPFELVYRLKTASGDYKWVWDKGEVLLDRKNATPILMEGFMMDITTFKHEEIRLQSFIRSASRERYRFGDIIGKSPEMKKIYEFIYTAALSDASVIIYGESGTGKELVARAIHKAGKRRKDPLVIVNCGAISGKLMESEFFGYKKGAFTGAGKDKKGFLAAAEGGTLFLDELGEISLEFQIKLLRVLDGHGYTPVGSNVTKKTDIRIIAATNKNLEELVKKGKMRKDFFYRVHIIPIIVPPLRKRKQDIPLLIDHFLEKYKKTNSPVQLPGSIRDALYSYEWPGNIRELENVVQRYVTLGEVESFENSHIHNTISQPLSEIHSDPLVGGFKEIMGNLEKQVLLKILEKNKWRRDKTAKELKLTRRTLYRKMNYHGMK